jgi:hypothetical protein
MSKASSVSRALAVLAMSLQAIAAEPEPKVCSDPAQPCGTFKEHDLSFALPADGKPRADVRSAPFFAVILKSGDRCRFSEAERREAQGLFPKNKVFATRFECDDDVENNVTYTGVDPKRGFLAVYAGEDRAAADAFLAKVKAFGRFPGANVRRLQAVFVGS